MKSTPGTWRAHMPTREASEMHDRTFAHRLAVEFDEKKIDAIFAELNQCHLPGAAVGIAIGGKPVYRKGFGLANMELPVVLAPTTRMRIASITKHFAAFAYMLLCEDSKAGIDDPIGKHLPELHPVAHKVTMRQLMGNIGGLRDVHEVCYLFSGLGPPISSAEQLSLYRDINDVNAAPGTAWIYNNGGWIMLGAVIERITGQTLEDVLRERVFEPVGMYETLLRRSDRGFVPNSATLHTPDPAGGYDKKQESSIYMADVTANGGMLSTVDDMLLWLAHMDAPRVGTAATWALMKAPLTLANGTSTGYGLGLVTGRYRGIETLYHVGGGTGGNAQMLKVPAAGLDVVIMVNRYDVSGVHRADKILDACLPGLDPAKKVTSGSLASGTFRSPTTGRVIHFCASATVPVIEEGHQIVLIDGAETQVEPDHDGVLWCVGFLERYKQAMTLVGDPVKPALIRFNDFGNLDELVRVQPVDKPNVYAIAGRYRSDTTGTEATICETDDGPKLYTVGRFGSAVYKLECLGDGIWRAKSMNAAFPLDAILSFGANGAAFRVSTHSTRSLPFRRCA